MIQHELLAPGPLLDASGNLAAVGWARQPLLDCNLENARFYPPWLRFLQFIRVKRWDYYAVTTPTHFFSFTLAGIGYIGQVFAYVIDFQTNHYHEETLTIPLAAGVHIPRNSTSGDSTYAGKDVRMTFSPGPASRRLEISWPKFEGKGLSASFELALPPDHQSLVIVIPIRGKRFYYNRKVNCLPASGWVEYAGQRYRLTPGTALGNLDWGRGVWEYRSFWVWASASGFLPDLRRVGLNLGFGFGDTSAATENALILDGCVHKLGQVDFTYDPHHFTAPWRMKSPDGRLDLEFVPFFERVAALDLKVLSIEVHQMFGRYSGTVVTDAGETITLNNLIGFAEEHHAKW